MNNINNDIKKVYNDYVVIERSKNNEIEKMSIFIPDELNTQQFPVSFGKVLKHGKGGWKTDNVDGKRWFIPISVKEGDIVMFGKYGGEDLKFGEDSYLIITEKHILAVIENS